jgi:hypothetical protein
MTEDIPPAVTTKEAMQILRVRSYNALNALLKKHGVAPAWRGGRGNVYRGADLSRIVRPIDTQEKGFHVF